MVADMDVLTNLLQSIEARMAHTEATTAELAQLLKHRAAESSVDTSAPSPGRATSRGGSHVGPVFFGVLLFVVGGVGGVGGGSTGLIFKVTVLLGKSRMVVGSPLRGLETDPVSGQRTSIEQFHDVGICWMMLIFSWAKHS